MNNKINNNKEVNSKTGSLLPGGSFGAPPIPAGSAMLTSLSGNRGAAPAWALASLAILAVVAGVVILMERPEGDLNRKVVSLQAQVYQLQQKADGAGLSDADAHRLAELEKDLKDLKDKTGHLPDETKTELRNLAKSVDAIQIAAGSRSRGSQGATGSTGAAGSQGTAGPPGPSGVASCPNGDCLSLQPASPGIQETGGINISGGAIIGGALSAGSLSGNGLAVSSLNASQLASGTVANSRLTSAVTLQGNSFNGASQLVQLTAGGLLPALDGSNLTNLNAANVTQGTLQDGRLSANVALLDRANQSFTGANTFTQSLTLQGGLNVSSSNPVVATFNGRVAAADAVNPGELATLSQVTAASSGAFVQNGNSFGTTAVLGTNDAFDLQLETGGTTKLTVQNSTGRVGIGTTSPSARLEVNGSGGASLPNAKFTDSGNGDTFVRVANSNGYYSDWHVEGAGIVSLRSQGVSFLNGTSGGNVGIGTTNPNEQLEITGNFRLPTTTATTGIIKSGANRFIHNYGTNNFFAGLNAGNLTTTGSGLNTGVGVSALQSLTTGSGNTATGYLSLLSNTGAAGNSGFGAYTLRDNVNGASNTAVGQTALIQNTSSFNTAVGQAALYSNTSGASNTALGYQAGFTSVAANANITGSNNTFIGFNAGPGISIQLSNATAIGSYAIVNTSNRLILGCIGGFNGCPTTPLVGIGVASPAAMLHVKTEAAITIGQIIQGAASQTADLQQWQNSAGTVLSKFDAGGNLSVGTSTSPTGGVATFNGNVGIGTTAPSALLHVAGNALVGGTLTVTGAANLQATLTVTGNAIFNGATLAFSNNVRGINQSIAASATTAAVTFGTPHADSSYAVHCTPNYNTSCFVSAKTTAGFTLNFGTAAPADASGRVDWLVVR